MATPFSRMATAGFFLLLLGLSTTLHAQTSSAPPLPALTWGAPEAAYGTRPSTVSFSLAQKITNCVVYQESTDMVHWSSVFTNTYSGGLRVFVKTNESRFYRILCQ